MKAILKILPQCRIPRSQVGAIGHVVTLHWDPQAFTYSSAPQTFQNKSLFDVVDYASKRNFAKKSKGKKKRGKEKDDEESDSTAVDDDVILFDPEKNFLDYHQSVRHALQEFEQELSEIQGGKPSPAMFENLEAHVYGKPTKIIEIAQISMKSPHIAIINVYDPDTAEAVKDAVWNSDLQLHATIDGTTLTVQIPREMDNDQGRTLRLLKMLGTAVEKCKTQISEANKVAMDELKDVESMSKDDIFREKKRIEELTQKSTKAIQKVTKAKKAELE